jgi:tetratricopeptide (TPR) repeat protein
MTRGRSWLVTAGLITGLAVAVVPALAADPDPDAEATEEDPELEGTILGAKRDRAPIDVTLRKPADRSESPGISQDDVAKRAADQLGMDPKLAVAIQEGLELLFLRKYEDARTHFYELEKPFPGTGLAAVADVLVWQALMMENFDYRYDKQYWTSSKAARQALEAAMQREGNQAFENFLMAGVKGIEAIHTMRKSRYLPALQLAFETMDHIETTRSLAPDYTDLLLADGMYNYWRTVVTESAPMLPSFGDHKAEGIEQMREVEANGVFLGPPATLSLAFTWIEEKDKEKARDACMKNRRVYPDNVINNLVLGSVHVSMKRYDRAIGVFDEILEDSPNNKRAVYWKGLALHKSGRLDQAMVEYDRYIAFDYMEDYQRAQAWYRKGQVHERKKAWTDAEEAYRTSIKIDGHKYAKKRLGAIKDKRKSGEIAD